MSDPTHQARDKRVKPRFKIQVAARIRAQLIGSSNAYEFVTENISESGLLVRQPPDHRHNFNEQTILEVWVRTEVGKEIFFFAKYVRQAGDAAFAMRIIDIDPENLELFQDFIGGLMEE